MRCKILCFTSLPSISLALIKDLRKAEVGYKQNSSYLENALKLGYELEAAYKDLGVEVPNLTSNKIDSCRYSIKEEQKLISAIKGMYGKF